MTAVRTDAPKIDLRRERRELYGATREPAFVDVPPLRCLMIAGTGTPGGPVFQAAIGALYSMAYTLKFALKRAGRADWTVAPIEGLWRIQDTGALVGADDPATMWWRLLIPQPDVVTEEDVDAARTEAARRRELPALADLRFDLFAEGMSAQILHVGPYDQEPATIQRLHAFIEHWGFRPHLDHHEIYLGDPNRCAPEKLKTILRQPVRH